MSICKEFEVLFPKSSNIVMNVAQFTIAIFKKAPTAVLGIGGLYLLAGILEFISLAALLPVLLNLLNATSDAGLVDEILRSFGLENINLKEALLIVIGLMSLRGMILFYADYSVARFARNLEKDIRHDLFNTVIYSNWAYLLTLEKGKFPNLILREASSYANAVQKLGQFAAGMIIAGVLILSSVFVSWQAFLIFAVAVVPYIILSKLANINIQNYARSRIEDANQIASYIGESATHLKYIKASGIETNLENRFVNAINNYAHHFLGIVFFKSFIKHFPEVFGVIILGALVFFSRTYIGESPADLIFFLLLLFRGYRQLATVQTSLSSLLELIPSYSLCKSTVEQTHPYVESFTRAKEVPKQIQSITVKNIGYYYDEKTKALNKVSLCIPPKGTIAIAGSSGAGKTTLSDILLGLLRPNLGEIIVNNELKLFDLNLQEWRKKIGYVPQDIFLITGTIRENILLGAEDQSDENLHKVAQIAHIHHHIQTLKNGYDTPVGDLGVRFSGGQKQRIALARALAKKPVMLILDEATSALDNLTEKSIQTAIHEISQSIPVIIIAHRLSTIKNADKIYVLEKGHIIEEGNYKTLMDNKGKFWKLNASSQQQDTK